MRLPAWARSLYQRERELINPAPIGAGRTVLRASYTTDMETTVLVPADRAELERQLKGNHQCVHLSATSPIVGHLELTFDDGRTVSFRVRASGIMNRLGASRAWAAPSILTAFDRR